MQAARVFTARAPLEPVGHRPTASLARRRAVSPFGVRAFGASLGMHRAAAPGGYMKNVNREPLFACVCSIGSSLFASWISFLARSAIARRRLV